MMGSRLVGAQPGPVATARSPRPSKLLFIVLAGGPDAMYSIDPKERHEIAPGIGPAFAPSDLLNVGALRVAPAWHALAPYVPRMAVVKGIQIHTVAHPFGHQKILQMRSEPVTWREPAFLTHVGEFLAPEAPLACVDLRGYPQSNGRILTDPDARILIEMHAIANDGRAYDVARDALAREGRLGGSASGSFRTTAALLDKLRGMPLPVPAPAASRIPAEDWPAFIRDQALKEDGLRLAWGLALLSHDITPAVLVPIFAHREWDTHANNDLQRPLLSQLALLLRFLLTSLDTTLASDGRPLAEHVGIAVLTEMGRDPYVNSYGGKDHLPQVDEILLGPGLRRGGFGETDRELRGTEVSFGTGQPGANGRAMTIDDLGRTLFEWVGYPDPERFGYHGSVLEFLLA
jgi:hypothetical protein